MLSDTHRNRISTSKQLGFACQGSIMSNNTRRVGTARDLEGSQPSSSGTISGWNRDCFGVWEPDSLGTWCVIFGSHEPCWPAFHGKAASQSKVGIQHVASPCCWETNQPSKCISSCQLSPLMVVLLYGVGEEQMLRVFLLTLVTATSSCVRALGWVRGRWVFIVDFWWVGR